MNESERVKSLIDLSFANMPAIMCSEKFIQGVKRKLHNHKFKKLYGKIYDSL